MAHTSIQKSDDSRYYEGDSLNINTVTLDRHSESPVDLTGATIDFYLKESRTDDDTDALLTKNSDTTTDHPNYDNEIDLASDPTTGEATIHIEDGDTEGVLTDDAGARKESKEFFWTMRVVDADGNRVSPLEGTWEIWSS